MEINQRNALRMNPLQWPLSWPVGTTICHYQHHFQLTRVHIFFINIYSLVIPTCNFLCPMSFDSICSDSPERVLCSCPTHTKSSLYQFDGNRRNWNSIYYKREGAVQWGSYYFEGNARCFSWRPSISHGVYIRVVIKWTGRWREKCTLMCHFNQHLTKWRSSYLPAPAPVRDPGTAVNKMWNICFIEHFTIRYEEIHHSLFIGDI